MRLATTFTALALGGAVFLGTTGLGEGGEHAPARVADSSEPRHQILGDWRMGRRGRIRVARQGGVVEGRALRTFRVGRCRVPRGSAVFRRMRFVERDGDLDVWRGTVVMPDRRCRRRHTRVRFGLEGDRRMVQTYVRGGRERTRTLRRIRPRVRDGDPLIGAWERKGLGVEVRLAGRAYEGRARESFLIANGCTIAAGEVIWHLRPLAPDRYDGTTRTFLPPPRCADGRPSRSRWTLSADGSTVTRESVRGDAVEYTRAGP